MKRGFARLVELGRRDEVVAISRARWVVRGAASTDALARFNPGVERGPHDRFCDEWRQARIGVEVARAAVGVMD